ncbi:aminopeptidase [Desulfovibrio psychrotolerans]|uniref:Aminopeptidase n=1 Tax=Desulfovibrio psychrotolerans TaxID=415242 RepID=A0A7J0BV82_9BACT|nr:aminopeptidase [Desulfovibrio psychrotolerans]GFM37081.1 aminopeptidase [Desulfovibrio psychrotolerans]
MFDTLTLEKYAEVMLWGLYRGRREPFRKSDFVLVAYDHEGLPLAEELCAQLHDRGLIPVPRALATPRMEYDKLTKANNKRLTTLIPGERDLYNHLNGSISIIAPSSLTHLAGVDPEVVGMAQKARQPLRSIMSTRENMGSFGWTLCIYPTQALAAQAGLSAQEYARQVEKACYLDDGTPVRKWRLLGKRIDELRAWLNSFGNCTLRVESETADLLLKVGEQRVWAGLTGRNLPSFELYVSPDARTVEGFYHADLPSFRSGNIIRDVRLEFRSGNVVSVQAEYSQEFVTGQLNLDPGASRVGEFALVDRRFSPISLFMANTLYDENHGGKWGSMHIALGNAYANTFAGDAAAFSEETRRALGFNSSMLHWDLVNTDRKKVTAITAHGTRTTIYEDGEFTL